jgi:Helix-turn-helix domain
MTTERLKSKRRVLPDEGDAVSLKSFTSQKLDWINSIVSDAGLKDLHCRVAVALSLYLNARTHECYVSQPTLAKRSCCTDRSVRTATNALVSRGYLSVQVNAGPNGTNLYRMIVPVKVNHEIEETLTPEATFRPPPERTFLHPRNVASAPPGSYVPTNTCA